MFTLTIKSPINSLTLHLKEVDKEEEIKPKLIKGKKQYK